jgi:hypothetical protein
MSIQKLVLCLPQIPEPSAPQKSNVNSVIENEYFKVYFQCSFFSLFTVFLLLCSVSNHLILTVLGLLELAPLWITLVQPEFVDYQIGNSKQSGQSPVPVRFAHLWSLKNIRAGKNAREGFSVLLLFLFVLHALNPKHLNLKHVNFQTIVATPRVKMDVFHKLLNKSVYWMAAISNNSQVAAYMSSLHGSCRLKTHLTCND